MTDKQIIIDGVDVSGCGELVKQDDNTLICEITGYLCEDRQNCYYKQLKRKEQECDQLKVENLSLKRGIEIAKEADKSWISQLKAENDELKRQHQGDKGLITSTGKMNYQLLQEYDKLKTALTEIKEIARVGAFYWKHYKEESKRYNEILQKISECEGNDEGLENG